MINAYYNFMYFFREAALTIFALFRSVIFRAIFEMVWLPDNFTICIVVVNFESTLIDDSFMFWKTSVAIYHQKVQHLTHQITQRKQTVNILVKLL